MVAVRMEKNVFYNPKGSKIRGSFTLSIIMVCYIVSLKEVGNRPFYRQVNYDERATEPIALTNDVKIWVPREGDQGGYENFPCVPYADMVEKIELRGEGLKQGFRIRSEYKDVEINGYGSVIF